MATDLDLQGGIQDAASVENGSLASAYTAKASVVAEETVVVNPGYRDWAAENGVEVGNTVVADMGPDMQAKLDPVMNPADGGIVTTVPLEHRIEVAGEAVRAEPAPQEDALGFGLLDRAVADVKEVVAGLDPEEPAPAPSLAPTPAPSLAGPTNSMA